MKQLSKEIGFLVINTILLAIIAYSSVNSLRVIKTEISHHRLRNEAENTCQLEALQKSFEQRSDLKIWLESYRECVTRLAGVEGPL